MGCTQAVPTVGQRHPVQETKASTKSSNELTEEALLVELIVRSAFFHGMANEDALKIGLRGSLVDSHSRLTVHARQQFLLGGVGIVRVDNEVSVAKRRDIYGDDCFVPINQSGVFTFRKSVKENKSIRRDSVSRESVQSRDRRDSVPDPEQKIVNRERTPSREDLGESDVPLKLVRLERKPLAVYSRQHLDDIAESSPALRSFLRVLEYRARFRTVGAFVRCGTLASFRPAELKSLGLGFDYCTLDTLQRHSTENPSSLGNFYYICDGAIQIEAILPSRTSSNGRSSDAEEDERVIVQVGKLETGSFISESNGLLQVQKRFSNKLRYSVAEKGVALYLSSSTLYRYHEHVFAMETKQVLSSEAKSREPKHVRRMFPVFTYLGDEGLELLMEACESINLAAGEDLPRPSDFHLVRKGSVVSTGAIRRRSIGAGLYVSGQNEELPNAVVAITKQGEFVANAGVIRIFNGRKDSRLGQTFSPSDSQELSSRPHSRQPVLSAINLSEAELGATAVDSRASSGSDDDTAVNDVESKQQDQRNPLQPSGGLESAATSFSDNTDRTTSTLRAIVENSIVWILPTDLVAAIAAREPLWEVDLEIRALRENASVEAILRHPVACYYFRLNLLAYHAEENLDFYLAACAYDASNGGSFPSSLSNMVRSSSPTPVLSPLMGLTKQLSGKSNRPTAPLSPTVTGAPQLPAFGHPRENNSGSVSPTPDLPSTEDLNTDTIAFAMFQEFIDVRSPRQINIAAGIRDQIKEMVTRQSPVPRNVFVLAQQECLKILITDGYPRFRATKMFDEMIRDVCAGTPLTDIMVAHEGKVQVLPRGSPILAAKRRLSRTSPSKPRPDPNTPSKANKLSWDVLDWSHSRADKTSSLESPTPPGGARWRRDEVVGASAARSSSDSREVDEPSRSSSKRVLEATDTTIRPKPTSPSAVSHKAISPREPNKKKALN